MISSSFFHIWLTTKYIYAMITRMLIKKSLFHCSLHSIPFFQLHQYPLHLQDNPTFLNLPTLPSTRLQDPTSLVYKESSPCTPHRKVSSISHEVDWIRLANPRRKWRPRRCQTMDDDRGSISREKMMECCSGREAIIAGMELVGKMTF